MIAFMLLLLHDLKTHGSRRQSPSDLDGLATAHMLLPVEGPEIRGVLSVLDDMRAKDAQQFPPVAQRKQREWTMLRLDRRDDRWRRMCPTGHIWLAAVRAGVMAAGFLAELAPSH